MKILNSLANVLKKRTGTSATVAAEKGSEAALKTLQSYQASQALEQQIAQKTTAQLTAAQTKTQDALKKNLGDLNHFAQREIPDIVAQQTEMLAQLNKLSQEMKSKIK